MKGILSLLFVARLLDPGPWDYFTGTVVTADTWMTPLRGHRSGWLTVYGNQPIVEANADFRGYDLSLSPRRCGLAAISPSMLGQIVWVRTSHGQWEMCYVVDVVSRVDWFNYTDSGYLADLPRWLVAEWGSAYGVYGEFYLGACPPGESSQASDFQPQYEIDAERPVRGYSGWPYPAQQQPVECDR